MMTPVISMATKLRKQAFSKVEISPARRTQTDISAKLSAASTMKMMPFDLLLIVSLHKTPGAFAPGKNSLF